MRWWYALPDWPPTKFDYNAKLSELKLREVDLAMWKLEDEVDK